MIKAYKYALLYFLLFSLLLLLSGGLLFEQKIGFSALDVLNYYEGNETLYIQKKSFLGILKIILPHLFAFGLFSMVALHFLIFTKKKNLQILVYMVYLTALLEMLTPFFIINGFELFAYLKLLSFFLFQGLIIYILWLLFFSIAYE